MKKSVCVLLPVYAGDNSDYFEECCFSLAKQSLAVDVCIVFDGPVGEQLSSVANKFLNSSSWFEVRLEKNSGLASALNSGIKEALARNYDYVARMDADDICLLDRFELQKKYLDLHPSIDLVGGAIIEFDSFSNENIISYPLGHSSMRRFFKKRDPLAHPSVLFRRSFFEKVGLYNTKLIKDQDTEFWFRGFKNGAIFANLEEPVLMFRLIDDTFNKRNDFKRLKTFIKLRLLIIKELNLGYISYLYLFIYIFIQISPSYITKIAYRYLK